LTKSLGSSQPGLSNAKVVTFQEIHGARIAFVCGICTVGLIENPQKVYYAFSSLLLVVVRGFRTNKY
jgi:hypothetical protein